MITKDQMLVTGSSGLIGSEVTSYFAARGWRVNGVDNNQRAAFFGTAGDTRWRQRQLQAEFPAFKHHELDIRDRAGVLVLIETIKPAVIVHTAAQPSHDLAATIPFDDFDINAGATLNLLEAARRHVPAVVFVHMSTNKVYGTAPNELPLVELPTRWDYVRDQDFYGVGEDLRIDTSQHSLFGASKLAADVMVQEYGMSLGINTVCLRGGCLTGPSHSGTELHGFLSYLIKCNVLGQAYRIYGYRGKQVRDNIHAYDVARFIEQFIERPQSAAVYNIGGGRDNSCSILEAIEAIQVIAGRNMNYEYVDKNRAGDHICYISDLRKTRQDYPSCRISKGLEMLFEEIYSSWLARV